MAGQDVLRALLHDLSSPMSVLLLMEEDLPVPAQEAVHKIRKIIENYRHTHSTSQ